MSIKVTAWVWKHANDPKRHRGTVKMLLLALAEHANDSGICWPSAATLADKINESERHTRRLIKELVEAGDLLVSPGGGRGNTTRYGIAVGLNAKQREKLNNALQNTVSQNTVYENTDIENSDIPAQKQCPTGTETVTSGHADEVPNSALESAKPTQKSGGNRHRTIIEPSNKTPRAVRAPSSGEHQELMAAYQEWLGYPIPNGGKEGAAARKLLKAGYTVAQVEGAYLDLKAQEFYADKHLSLVTVHEQIGALMTQQEQKRRAKERARTNGANGTHAPAASALASLSPADVASGDEVARAFRAARGGR